MALNLTKPADDTLGDASEIRANQTALAQSLYGQNIIPNGEFLIWPSTSLPAHFSTGGTTPTITRETGATYQVRSGWSMKAIGGAGQGYIYYRPVSANDWHTGWRGVQVHIGCWLWSDTANSIALFINGGGAATFSVSSYHPGTSNWQWITHSYTLPSDADLFTLGITIGNTKTGYAWGLTGGLYGAPPQDFVPCPRQVGTMYFPQTGSAVAETTYDQSNFEFKRPALILGANAICRTEPAGSNYTFNLGKLTTAPSTYTALYSSDLAIATTKLRGDATTYVPNSGGWENRCFDGNVTPGDTLVANTIIGKKVVAAGGTAAVDAKVMIEVMQFLDPLAGWKLSGEFK